MFKIEIMYNHSLFGIGNKFHHSFDEYQLNDTSEVVTQQYILNVLGTAICVRIALNTGLYKHLGSSIQ